MELKEETKKSKRVAITGIGLISSIGKNYSEFSRILFSEENGFKKSSYQERNIGASEYVGNIDSEVVKEISNYLTIPFEKVINDLHNPSCLPSDGYVKRAELFLLWSCLTAFENSKLNTTHFNSYDGGIFLGIDAQNDDFFHYYNYFKNTNHINEDINFEDFSSLVKQNIEQYYPYSGPFHLIDKLLDKLPFTGDIELLMNGCSSSNDCIGTAFHKIRSGQLQYALCGAVDIPLDPLYYAMFNSLNILSKPLSKNECLVPYSSDHFGFTLSEGAGIVMLEDYENALNRGACIYGEVIGYSSNMANAHLTNCDPEGELYSVCIKNALIDANIEATDIDYINSHGISTILDVSETKAIKRVFGSKSYDIPISSTKSIIGHSMVASGVLECIAILACFENEKIHPTLGLKVAKKDCDLQYTPQQAIKKTIKNAISTSYAFLGYNSCLVLQNNNINNGKK
ncbi:beta-ketoacyl-[acyl-carrier-protein] synthase family protein [Bacteroides sp.]|jgi:fabF|uniref:beta-ketoacyl-[acyl-carrier-protein] synthase family protein n=1 Tax=Bacteroides sp. TaxID=29523 RepID=UPI00260612E0|nr:beta-ketoacyl-[acyl-carrier-protein] synthase family protein [Bacteroides sp.]MDD3038025.1 beta-ketoacyl-[acyl-carrier-protein] synthase family protein [Bacteroides sp.]